MRGVQHCVERVSSGLGDILLAVVIMRAWEEPYCSSELV